MNSFIGAHGFTLFINILGQISRFNDPIGGETKVQE